MTLQFKNAPIFYEILGKGEPLILLHGFLEHSGMWKSIANTLKRDYQLVLIDLPGHGKSGSFGQIHTMEDMADSVLDVLAKLNIKKANFVGHSMGGYVLLALAERSPEIIDKLILLNSTPFPDSTERLANRKQALKLLSTVPDKFISMAITNLFAANNRQRLARQIEQLKKEALAMDLNGITAAIKGMMQRPDRSSLLTALKTKCGIIASEEDALISATAISQIAKANMNKFQLLPGGHMSTFEHPKLSLAAIKKML